MRDSSPAQVADRHEPPFRVGGMRKVVCVATAAERKALNEGTFREANEQLERSSRQLVSDAATPIPFICECPRQECR